MLVDTATTDRRRTSRTTTTAPFVQEKFHEDWSTDQRLGLAAEPRGRRPQPEDRLEPDAHPTARGRTTTTSRSREKIAEPDAEASAATRSAAAGTTWSSATLQPRARPCHRYAWHDRKAWWQQEQGILAYLILHGSLKKPEYLKHARESSAFYNAFFLDHDIGARLLQRAGQRHARTCWAPSGSRAATR